ncbi:MAG TPA: hypothetical protein VHA52_08475 [Candidatus Babeliaceae bacterium]|nr:hypothetical protein [Candidatus Babeliaceae bacterium]
MVTLAKGFYQPILYWATGRKPANKYHPTNHLGRTVLKTAIAAGIYFAFDRLVNKIPNHHYLPEMVGIGAWYLSSRFIGMDITTPAIGGRLLLKAWNGYRQKGIASLALRDIACLVSGALLFLWDSQMGSSNGFSETINYRFPALMK